MKKVVQFALTGLMLAGMIAGASTTFKAANGDNTVQLSSNWTPAPPPPGGGGWTPAPAPTKPGGPPTDGSWTPAPAPTKPGGPPTDGSWTPAPPPPPGDGH